MCWGRLENVLICVWHGFGWNRYNLLAIVIEMLNGTFSVTVTRKSRIYEYRHKRCSTSQWCVCTRSSRFLLNMGPQLLAKLFVMSQISVKPCTRIILHSGAQTFNCAKKKKKKKKKRDPPLTGGGLSDLQSCVVSQSCFSPSVFSRCWAGSVMVSPCWMPAWWTPALCLRPSSCRGSMNSSRWL